MRLLITSGPVHARLDDNKILTNRARGIWATRFACEMAMAGHSVRLLLSSLTPDSGSDRHVMMARQIAGKAFEVATHDGYESYRKQCLAAAGEVDAAVLAAAVINYLPESPYEGKMPTSSDKVTITLVKAPSVIAEMRRINPALTLIGSKLTSRAPEEVTIAEAQKVITAAKAHAIVANDRMSLRTKIICMADGYVLKLNNDFDKLTDRLIEVIKDQHFQTEQHDGTIFSASTDRIADQRARETMRGLLRKYGPEFAQPWAGGSRSFGAIAVRLSGGRMLVTRRHKPAGWPLDRSFEDAADECPVVDEVDLGKRTIRVGGPKATVNAPLLWRMLKTYPSAPAVVHLHRQLEDAPVQPHAQPGTARDTMRVLSPQFNIEGHGFVALAHEDGTLA